MKNNKTAYTTSHIARLNIKRERLKVWMEKHWIRPSVQVASGAGTKNLFDRWDLYMILLFKNLLEHGFIGELTYSIIQSLNHLYRNPAPGVNTLPKKDRKRAQQDYAERKEQIEKDFLAFVKKTIGSVETVPVPQFFGFNGADDYAKWSKYLSKLDVIVIVNFAKIKKQVDDLDV